MNKQAQLVAQEVLEVIPVVMRAIRKEFRSRRDPDLSLPEFRGLVFINRSPGCSLNDVAEHIGLEAPTTSKLVESLVRRGLVSRREDMNDRRRVNLSILPDGQKTIDAAFQHTHQFLTRHLAHLSEGERQSLFAAMETLKAAFASEANREANPTS